MAVSTRRCSRRAVLLSALSTLRLSGQSGTSQIYPSDWRRYPDPATEFEVFRLTDSAYSSTFPAYYNRFITRNSGTLLFCCDRAGTPQAFRMDLNTGETAHLTETEELDGASLTLLPDNRGFCYFAGRTLWMATLVNPRPRQVYTTPAEWEPCPAGMSVAPDGSYALLVERQGERWRLRQAPLLRGQARTVVEAPFALSAAVARPARAQILYRGNGQLWMVGADGRQNRSLPLARGETGPASWGPDGKSILYLNFPEDQTQLNAIREHSPEEGADKLVAKTSQFVHFGFNQDSSVFVGASRNAASPNVLILLRVTRREMTICEHKARNPEAVAPVFSPNSQRIYFQSDRHGKPAIYCIHVERLVEKIEAET